MVEATTLTTQRVGVGVEVNATPEKYLYLSSFIFKSSQQCRRKAPSDFHRRSSPAYSFVFRPSLLADSALVPRPKKLRFDLHHVVFTLYGCCNGLVLVSAHNFDGLHSLVILNPTTREIMELPESNYEVISNRSEIEIVYGFGYDSLTDDYKVVTISYFHNHHLIPPDTMSVHVYSLRTNTWRWVTDSPYDFSYGKFVSGVFLNGFLHWIAKKGSDSLPVTVAFSLADDTFIQLPSPNLCNDVHIMSRNDCKLVVLDGKLAILMDDEIWLMKQYGVRESWTKISIHGLDGIPMVEPMFLDENGKILLVSRNLMLMCDVEERSLWQSVHTSQNLKDLKLRGTYIESLVSPKFSI
ncbi:F-box/kelch-repeat protein At3g06240-like [Cynara cardunculus var. scolymus]|uniref:F-box/kelch-repeat protein At3g06240-like n=1 Tax=Cynara cardunculus var. scolymus TaxID=59895 RepID=UPI000D628F8C|nr:F-box/kelch-repeat protein At3g06240-like [Cynara cardunculus var. scolymus]